LCFKRGSDSFANYWGERVNFRRKSTLRHQQASFLVNAGHTLYAVQKILGHSDAKVMERYAHLSSATLLAASNSVSVAMRGAGRTVAKVQEEANEVVTV
jgi:integrase